MLNQDGDESSAAANFKNYINIAQRGISKTRSAQNFLPSYLLIPSNLIGLRKRIKLHKMQREGKEGDIGTIAPAYFTARLDKLS